MLQLKALSPENAQAEYDCLQEMAPENGFYNACHGMSYEQFVSEGIPQCMKSARGEDLKPGRVPETWYLLWDDDRAVALFKVRHYLNEGLRERGGHIGYAVRPSQQRRGLATEILKEGVALARSSGF